MIIDYQKRFDGLSIMDIPLTDEFKRFPLSFFNYSITVDFSKLNYANSSMETLLNNCNFFTTLNLDDTFKLRKSTKNNQFYLIVFND